MKYFKLLHNVSIAYKKFANASCLEISQTKSPSVLANCSETRNGAATSPALSSQV